MMKALSRKNGHTMSHETLEEMRMMGVRMIQQGHRAGDIAAWMRLNRSCVFRWVQRYRQGGVEALRSTKATGAPGKLKESQILKLMEMLRRPAMDYDFDSDLWTGPRVRRLIKKKFGIRFHPRHMPRFLRRLGLVRKSPERRALEQDPKKIRQWQKQILPRIQRQARQSGGLILYGDEASFFLIPHIGKTWTFPEVRPIARVSGQKGIWVGVTSAVSPRGHLVFKFAKGNFNSATLIDFMKSLRQHFRGRKLFFIIDGAPSHRAKVVQKFVQDHSSWLSLFRLPAYSPELNPDEEVWNFAKTKQLDAKPMKDKKELRSKVLRALRSLQKIQKR
ncbi:MAG: IS630 family transposase [Planctomycetes bacterium]|nr:IS630 family transposase [Planctomycetota bacterium]